MDLIVAGLISPFTYAGTSRLVRRPKCPSFARPVSHLQMSFAEFNWNVFPLTKLEETNMVTPLGCMFTPFKEECPMTDKELILCSQCGGYINSYIKIDRQNKMWRCPLCKKSTYLPDSFELHETSSSDLDIPIQIRPTTRNTLEYLLPTDISQSQSSATQKAVIALLLDRYQLTDSLHLNEFNALKSSLIKELTGVPKDARILLVTFADEVEVHCLKKREVVSLTSESFILNSDDFKFLLNEEIVSALKAKLFNITNQETNKNVLLDSGYLLTPSQELFDYISSLRPKITTSFKAPRETGLAFLTTTLILANFCAPYSQGKIHAFLSGPGTVGPGHIVTESEHIRSHHDLSNFKAPHFVSATKFYRLISHLICGYKLTDVYKAVFTTRGNLLNYTTLDAAPKFSCDLYTGSLDQCGIYEMKHMANASGGNIILTDSFASIKFSRALSRQFQCMNNRIQSCKLSVLTSPGVKILKAIGGITELQSTYQSAKLMSMHHNRISDSVTRYDSILNKRAFTNQWYMGHVSKGDTVALYFEFETASSSSALHSGGTKEAYIQFHLKFWDAKILAYVLRVMTLSKRTTLAVLAANQLKLSNGEYRLVNTRSKIMKEKALLESFNSKVWIALFARLLISKIDTGIGFDSFDGVVHEVDNALFRILKVFGGVAITTAATDNPFLAPKSNYTICLQFKDLPALSYSLRRNPQLVRIFNSSPDETAYNHHLFLKSDSNESWRMIRPILYRIEKDGLHEVLPNVDSVRLLNDEQQFYVLDNVFNITIFNQFSRLEDKINLHHSNNENIVYGDVKNDSLGFVLDLVRDQIIARHRFEPNIILTQRGHSQARFLTARLNPVGLIDIRQERNPKSRWWHFADRLKPIEIHYQDELSQDQFYDELVEKMGKFRIESDY